jgi:2-polyprenyl-6-methoxyphenol hydroxylase-like FAD-dependent oxidoreductase
MKSTAYPQTNSHAIVIGGSVAGLTLARVLADHFAQVTIIERDHLPDTPEFRRGVPQTRHSHLLLPQGQSILEEVFPGVLAELVSKGATVIGSDKAPEVLPDLTWYDDVPSIACSRPLLENSLYRRLATSPKINFIQSHEVTNLWVAPVSAGANKPQAGHVAGVYLRGRHNPAAPGTKLAANLVVDASGRGSPAPEWLASLGYTPPKETIIDPFSGYASRIYRRPPGFNEEWKLMRSRRTPGVNTRGGMIMPLEGDRWHVTLVGMNRDYPSTGETGFLEFARSLSSPRLYEAIKAAEPLTKPYGFRATNSRLRHYEKLPRYLEGFLVGGDAACALSPVHTLGLTAAVIAVQTLKACLAEQPYRKGFADLAQRFQQQLRQDLNEIWLKVTESDRAWPGTEVFEEITPVQLRAPKVRRNSEEWRLFPVQSAAI